MVQPIIIRYFRFGKTTTNASTNEHKFKPIRFKISIDQSERGSWWRNGCTSRNDRSYENGWIWWCMNNSWFFVTCHFRHMSRDESFITWLPRWSSWDVPKRRCANLIEVNAMKGPFSCLGQTRSKVGRFWKRVIPGSSWYCINMNFQLMFNES